MRGDGDREFEGATAYAPISLHPKVQTGGPLLTRNARKPEEEDAIDPRTRNRTGTTLMLELKWAVQ